MKRALLLVFVLSLAVRLLLYGIVNRPSEESYAHADCRDYFQLGRNLANHGVLSSSEEPPYRRSTHRTPAYPVLIATALKISPNEESALKVVILSQLVLGALTASLCAAAAHFMLKQTKWAVVVGLLVGLEPSGIRHSMMIWTEVPFTFVLILGTVLLLKHFNADRPLTGFLLSSAAVLGLATLFRPVGQQVALLAVPFALLVDSRFTFRKRVAKALLPFCACYAIITIPWAMRNYLTCDVPGISSMPGIAAAMIAIRIEAITEATVEKPSADHDISEAEKRLLSTCLREFYENYPTAGTSGEEDSWGRVVDKKFPWAYTDVVPEQLTGAWMRFLAKKSKLIIMDHLGLYVKESSVMCLNMLFGFNKDIFCTILKIPRSGQGLSAPWLIFLGDVSASLFTASAK